MKIDNQVFIEAGRESQLEKLHSTLATVIKGNPQFLFIVGEAGIGKTRLVRELTTHVNRHGRSASTANSTELLPRGCLQLYVAVTRPTIARNDAWLSAGRVTRV